MAQVVCQVLAHPARITVRWSEGPRSFEPYHLEGEALQRFWDAARQTREQLRHMAPLDLARAGHQLQRSLFPREGPDAELVKEIRGWLDGLHAKGRLKSLEITGDTVGQVPWQALYDTPPDEAAFAQPTSDTWSHFWGCRYPLGMTHRVNPLRGADLVAPRLLLAVDPELRAGLPAEQRDLLQAFAAQHSLTPLETPESLAAELKTAVPDILLLLVRVHDGSLRLGGATLSPRQLRECLTGSPNWQVPWNSLLVVLQPCGEAGSAWEDIRTQLLCLRLAGLIVPQWPVQATVAARFTLDFAAGLLSRGEALGTALRKATVAGGPASLTWAGCCPPQVRVTAEDAEADEDAGDESADAAGQALPDEPYHPLVPLDREERSLLVGRDNDIAVFTETLDTPGVRLALLHGRSGVGKASLLRGGVIPHLDDEALGYLALRDRSVKDPGIKTEKDYPIVDLHATNDLVGQLAPALSAFVARPWTYTTPTGRKVTVDLAAALRQALNLGATNKATSASADPAEEAPLSDAVTPQQIYAALQQESAALGQLLRALAERLPVEPVLVIEQAEEIFAMARTGTDVQNRQRALALLAAVAETPGHAKIILSLSTTYTGRFAARLRPGVGSAPYLAEYLLPALSTGQLAEVLERPTETKLLPYSTEIPGEKYGLRFEDDLPQRIARQALHLSNAGQEEALPLVQAVGALMYQRVAGRDDKTVTAADVHQALPGFLAGEDAATGQQTGLKALLSFFKGPPGPRAADRDGQMVLTRYVEQLVAAVARPTERKLLWQLLEELYARQPDGSLTRTLATDADLASRWRGTTPWPQLLTAASAPNVGLLDERVGATEAGEQSVVSLGHEVVPAAVEQHARQEERRRLGRARMIDALWIFVPIIIVLLLGLYYLVYVPQQRLARNEEKRLIEKIIDSREKTKEFADRLNKLQRAVYPARIAQAQAAWRQGDWLTLQQSLAALAPTAQQIGEFDFRFLWQQAQGSQLTLPGHQGAVAAVATDAEGKLLLSGSEDSTVRVWDLGAKGENKMLAVQVVPDKNEQSSVPLEAPIAAVAVAPGGTLFATAGRDGALTLWEIKIKTVEKVKYAVVKTRHKLVSEGKAIMALAFADDDTLISAGTDAVVHLWDTASGKETQALKDHKGTVKALAVTPDGKTFASADAERVLIWDTASPKKPLELKTGANGLAFSPSGKLLASAEDDEKSAASTIHFWDAKSGKEGGKDMHTNTPVLTLAFGADEKTVLTAGQDWRITVWDVSGKAKHSYKGHTGWIGCLAVDRKNNRVISGSVDSLVKVWELQPRPDAIKGHEGAIFAVAISPDNKLVATGGEDRRVNIWDLKTGEKKHSLKADAPVRCLTFAALDKKLRVIAGIEAAASKPGLVLIWDAESGTFDKELKGHKGTVNGLAVARGGKMLATAGEDGTARIWDLVKGEEKLAYKKHQGPVRSIALLAAGPADGDVAASGGGDGSVRIWLTENGEMLYFKGVDQETFRAFQDKIQHASAVTSLLFMPLDRDVFFASSSAEGIVRISAVTGTIPLYTLKSHTSGVTALGWNSDSLTLFSAGLDHTVSMASLRVGQTTMTLEDHQGPVYGVALSSDLNTLVSVGSDGMIRFYRAAP